MYLREFSFVVKGREQIAPKLSVNRKSFMVIVCLFQAMKISW